MGEPSPLGNPSRNARKCMCRGDDHLTWKHPVSLEVCKGLCTTGGSIFVPNLDLPSWTRVRAAPILALEDAHAHMDRLKLYMVYRRALLEDCGPSLPLVIQRGRSPQEDKDQEMWGLGHDTDHCVTLRHAIQDLIDQGLVNLGQPSVTTRPLPTHSMHAMPPPPGVPFELTPIAPLATARQGPSVSFILWPDDDDSKGRDVQIVTHSGRVAQSSPLVRPLVARPFDGVVSHEEALSHIQVETTTTQRVGCSGHRVPSILLDNGSALNVYPLATAIALGYAPSDFGPST
ncbi:hypothetical protein CK203_107366 [Vitis vinifera]|uniref:Uncharacterized protein n=1 Tax=Vitis vinifera TaxID=29760 RepID=A0A438FGA7_VITVI|nr:hypothetical protein CK203_107366 [Vitis vinifera]